jgi:hypothetical protein
MREHVLRSAALAAAVAAPLGFGTAQALAAPAEAESASACQSICVFQCGAPGGREIIRGGPCICCRD